MSTYAKALVASLVAVVYAGLTAWQAATGDGFQVLDLFPLGLAVAGAVLAYVVPNVPQLPAAKAVVQGVLSVLAALSTLVADNPAGVDATAVLVTIVGALLVYQVPTRGAVIEGETDGPVRDELLDPPGQHAADRDVFDYNPDGSRRYIGGG